MIDGDPVGAILRVHKFCETPETKRLTDLDYLMRLVAATEQGDRMMNHYRCPALGALESYSWTEVQQFQEGLGVLRA